MQTLYVKEKQGECPHCHIMVNEMNPPKGKFGRGGSHKLIGRKANPKHLEILGTCVLFGNEIFNTEKMRFVMNNRREIHQIHSLQQNELSTPMGNLVALGIINWQYQSGKDHYYKINVEKAKALLNGQSF